PKADTPEAAWQLMLAGEHAISEAPPMRWATRQKIAAETNAKVQSYPKWGGYLDNIDHFDNRFFGISMREARLLDPQHRLLLETSWQAIESSGFDPLAFKGSHVGVFVGISTSDYLQRQLLDAELLRVDAYSSLGSAQSIAANRLSYFYDFDGPSMSVDTACSSSLVALHLARRSLLAGECDYAIVGGVNVIVSPLSTISFSKARMLAPDGRCKSFDQRADGYVRSEGCVTVLLARAADARRDGHRIRALVRGSAVNQDGNTLSITTPRAEAQQRVISDALAAAGLAPADIDLLEAHGTGTKVGDAIELSALHAVFDPVGRREQPILVGTAKPHFGHLEAASGLVGLLKAVKSLEHRTVPALPSLKQPVEEIGAGTGALELARETTSLAGHDRPLRAGISCFGFGGTNSHVIIEQTVEVADTSAKGGRAGPPPVRKRPLVLPVSSHSSPSFAATVADYAALVASDEALDLGGLCASAATLRAHQPLRRAVVFSTREELVGRLEALGKDVSRDDEQRRGKLAFCFSGQGAQFPGMCRTLFDADADFRSALLLCNEVTETYGKWSLLDILALGTSIDDTRYAQPALFAIGLGLARSWMARGLNPDYLIGHSLGEIIAACVAGVMDEVTAMRLVLARGLLMAAAPGKGAMISLTAEPGRLASFLETALVGVGGSPHPLEISGRNTPRNVTVSGAEGAIDAILPQAEGAGIKGRKLSVSHAFHSSMMDAILDKFETEVSAFTFAPPRIPMVSNVTGELIADGERMDAGYWRRHIRAAVDFRKGIETLASNGVGTIVEIGPRPILSSWMREMSPRKGGFSVIPALGRNRDDEQGLLEGLALAYARGWDVEWSSQLPHLARADRQLPPYRFSGVPIWFETYQPTPGTPLIANTETAERGAAEDDLNVLSHLDIGGQAFATALQHHRVGGHAVVPGALYLELLVAAARKLIGALPVVLENCRFPNMLTAADAARYRLQVTGQALADQRWALSVTAIQKEDGNTRTLANAVASASGAAARTRDLAALAARLDSFMSGDDLYASLEDIGLGYGPVFRGLAEVRFGGGEASARVTLPQAGGLPHEILDPCLLDASLHAIAPALRSIEGEAGNGLWVPIGCRKLVVHGTMTQTVHSHVLLSDGPHFPDQKAFDVAIFDDQGQVQLELEGLEIRRLENRQGAASSTGPLFHVARVVLPALAVKPAEAAAWKADWWIRGLTPSGELVAQVARAFGLAPKAPDVTLPPSGRSGQTLLLLLDEADARGAGPEVVKDFTLIAQELARGKHSIARLVTLYRSGAEIAAGPSGEAIRAAMRVLRNEVPALKGVSVTVPADASDAVIEVALASAWHRADEPDQLWADGGMHALRLQPVAAGGDTWAPRREAGPEKRLVPGAKGGISNLQLAAVDRDEPGPREVLIVPAAAGLNFRDVLKSLRLYPNRPGMPLWLGDECAGTVVAVGKEVGGFEIGDRVMAITPGAFSTSVVARQDAVVKLPEDISFIDAATMPVAFTTAWFGLVELGRVRAGDTVLIHAAAGGVGLAAVQIALAHGAKVIGTAGSTAKRDYLLSHGVIVAGNSRDLSFVEAVREATDGRGVDIVLNSLSGDAIAASVGLLKPFGRFVEIGKRDIVEGTALSLRPFHKSVSFHSLDMELLFATDPEKGRDVLEAVADRLASGTLTPLPREVFALDKAAEGFQYMAQAKNIGKVVITFDRPSLIGGATAKAKASLVDAALVTGAFGGIGIELVQLLARAGIGGFVLVGRREPGKSVAKILDRLRARGATIITAAADASDEAAIAELMHKSAPAAGLGVRHIFHAAGVLADRLIADVEAGSIDKAWAPKVIGADILDRLSRELAIESFVCLSSISTVLGSPGQIAYAAANGGMDAICARRRAEGLPATALSFGPWETGLSAANDETKARFERLGLRSFSVSDGMRVFDRALTTEGPLTVVARFAPQFPSERVPAIASIAMCRDLYRQSGDRLSARRSRRSDAMQKVFAAESSDRKALMAAFLAGKLAAVMSQSVDDVPTDRPLEALGFDSLAGLEFGMMVEEEVGMQFPMDVITETTTLLDLAGLLLAEMDFERLERDSDDADADVDAAGAGASLAEYGGLAALGAPALSPPPVAATPFRPIEGSNADYLKYVNPDVSQLMSIFKLDATYAQAGGSKLASLNDGKGREVTDFATGNGTSLFGHNHPALVAAANRALTSGRPERIQGAFSPLAGELARQLSETLSAEAGGEYRVAFSGSRAEAMEDAIRHAAMEFRTRFKSRGVDVTDPLVQATASPAFLAIEGSYHGMTLGAFALGDFRHLKLPSLGLRMRQVPRNDIAALARILEEEQFELEGQPISLLAGAFAEPVQGEGGVNLLDAEFLRALRDGADRYGFPLVFDESQCGFYRCGRFVASSGQGTSGDYYVLGDGLGGGIAELGAVLIRAERYQHGFGVVQTQTFAVDKLAPEVGLAALRLARDSGVGTQARTIGALMLQKLEALSAAYADIVSAVRGKGLMLGVDIADCSACGTGLISHASRRGMLAQTICSHLLVRHGFRVATAFSAPGTIRLQPAATITETEIDALVAALAITFEAIRKGDGGYLISHLLDEPDWIGESTDWRAGSPPVVVPSVGTAARRVAFIGHFADDAAILRWDASWGRFTQEQREKLLARIAPVVPPSLVRVETIRSASGEEVEMQFISLFASSNTIEMAMRGGTAQWLIEQVREALDMAVDAGCTMAGLGGFLSIVTHNGSRLPNAPLGLTTGNALTIGAGIAALQREVAARLRGEAIRIGIVGAAGNIGRTYVRALAADFDHLTLVGRLGSTSRLVALAEELKTDAAAAGRGPPKVAVADHLGALRDCNVIVSATNTSAPIIYSRHLGEGPVIMLDISVPPDVDPNIGNDRPDVHIVPGGLVGLPEANAIDLGGFGLAGNQMYACMAETALLGLENHTKDFAVGEVSLQQVTEISALAAAHGFRLGATAVADP
ncbi:MAG: aminotransferase class III-fold pyridoxal phosphate-dependent enzyme, partial [Devosia sp.]